MARANKTTRPPDSLPPVDPGQERAAMTGILAGVVLSTGINLLLRDALALPYVGLFGTYFMAAFGGYFAWRMVMRRQIAPLGIAPGAVGMWCALVALVAAAVFTLGIGALGLAMDDGPAANAVALPLVVVAFFMLRRWLAERKRPRGE